MQDHLKAAETVATMTIERLKQDAGHNGLSPEGFKEYDRTVSALLAGLLARVSLLTLENERLRAPN